jgi:hypothetical protein
MTKKRDEALNKLLDNFAEKGSLWYDKPLHDEELAIVHEDGTVEVVVDHEKGIYPPNGIVKLK